MGRGGEKYSELALDDLMDVRRGVLVEPDLIIAVSFLFMENEK